MIIRTTYSEKTRSRITFKDRSLTKQASKKECDINFIISKFQKTGLLTHTREHEGQYADFEESNFHDAMNIVTTAQSMFESVPSSIREQFHNDPGEFIEFATNPENQQALFDLGLSDNPPTLPDTPIEQNNAPTEQPTALKQE